MSEPQTPAPPWPPPSSSAPAWGEPSWGEPSWSTGSWAGPAGPPAVPTPQAVVPTQPAGRRRAVPLVLVGAAAFVVGAVGAAFLVSAVFLSSAEDIGRAMAQGMGEKIGTSIGEGMAQAMGGPMTSQDLYASPPAPADQSPAVPPVPGPDPVLNTYAQNCYSGDLQACDDLYYESPPLSDYEQYAVTCAGRVKAYSVAVCTDLD